MSQQIRFKSASQEADFAIGVTLFKAYQKHIGIDLTFQDFEQEIKSIHRQYAAPSGNLTLVYWEQHAIGCFAIRKLTAEICELKRMYLKPDFQGRGLGGKMLMESLKIGALLGYSKMRLDTLPSMKAAIGLYKKHGFYEIEAYRENPFSGAHYLQKDLDS